jgi:hypothetical protein
MVQETAIPKKASPNWPTISRDKKGCVEVKGVAFIRDKRYGMPYKATPDKPDAGANGNRLARLGPGWSRPRPYPVAQGPLLLDLPAGLSRTPSL